MPSYYDPKYDCEMEILRFDTRKPSARFVKLVESIKERFADIPVIAAANEAVLGASDAPGAFTMAGRIQRSHAAA